MSSTSGRSVVPTSASTAAGSAVAASTPAAPTLTSSRSAPAACCSAANARTMLIEPARSDSASAFLPVGLMRSPMTRTGEPRPSVTQPARAGEHRAREPAAGDLDAVLVGDGVDDRAGERRRRAAARPDSGRAGRRAATANAPISSGVPGKTVWPSSSSVGSPALGCTMTGSVVAAPSARAAAASAPARGRSSARPHRRPRPRG